MKKIILLLITALLIYGCAAKPKMIKAVGSDTGELDVYVVDGVISFQGNYEDIQKKFPYSSSIINEKNSEGISYLSSLYTSSICNAKPKYFKIAKNMDYGKCSFSMIDINGKTFAPAISLVIDREEVSIVKIYSPENKEIYKIMAMMSFKILSIDMVSSNIISSLPIYITYIDSVDNYHEAYNPKLHKKMFQTILKDEIPKMFTKKLEDMVIKSNSNKRIAIKNVTIDQMKPKSLQILNSMEPDINIYKTQVANLFTQMLSEQLHVPFIPYAEDAVLGKMTLSFVNSEETSSFQIPKADYGIDINLQGYRVNYKEFEDGTKLGTFAAFSNVTANINYLQKNIFNCDISTAVQNDTIYNFKNVDLKDSLYRAVRELAYKFAENIYAPKRKWLKTSIKCENKKAKQALKDLSAMFDSIREE